MRESKDAQLDRFDVGFVADSLLEDFAVILWEKDGIYEDTDVMQKAGEIGLLLRFRRDFCSNMLCQHCGAQGVAPKHFLGNRAAKLGEHQRQAAGESRVADAPEPKRHDSFANGGDFAALTKESGIGKPRALGGQRFVVRNVVDYQREIDIAGALAERFAKRGQNSGHGG
jgi:hypothetical protein